MSRFFSDIFAVFDKKKTEKPRQMGRIDTSMYPRAELSSRVIIGSVPPSSSLHGIPTGKKVVGPKEVVAPTSLPKSQAQLPAVLKPEKKELNPEITYQPPPECLALLQKIIRTYSSHAAREKATFRKVVARTQNFQRKISNTTSEKEFILLWYKLCISLYPILWFRKEIMDLFLPVIQDATNDGVVNIRDLAGVMLEVIKENITQSSVNATGALEVLLGAYHNPELSVKEICFIFFEVYNKLHRSKTMGPEEKLIALLLMHFHKGITHPYFLFSKSKETQLSPIHEPEKLRPQLSDIINVTDQKEVQDCKEPFVQQLVKFADKITPKKQTRDLTFDEFEEVLSLLKSTADLAVTSKSYAIAQRLKFTFGQELVDFHEAIDENLLAKLYAEYPEYINYLTFILHALRRAGLPFSPEAQKAIIETLSDQIRHSKALFAACSLPKKQLLVFWEIFKKLCHSPSKNKAGFLIESLSKIIQYLFKSPQLLVYYAKDLEKLAFIELIFLNGTILAFIKKGLPLDEQTIGNIKKDPLEYLCQSSLDFDLQHPIIRSYLTIHRLATENCFPEGINPNDAEAIAMLYVYLDSVQLLDSAYEVSFSKPGPDKKPKKLAMEMQCKLFFEQNDSARILYVLAAFQALDVGKNLNLFTISEIFSHPAKAFDIAKKFGGIFNPNVKVLQMDEKASLPSLDDTRLGIFSVPRPEPEVEIRTLVDNKVEVISNYFCKPPKH